MRNLDDCVRVLGLVEQRLDSQDKLFELLDNCFSRLWWKMGTEEESAIRDFRVAHAAHRALVVKRIGMEVAKTPLSSENGREPCNCDERRICSGCFSERGIVCPGLPGKYECGRTATPPGEMRLYGHCLLCEGLAEAERSFRRADAERRANQNLNDLPLPGYVRHIDASRMLSLYDILLSKMIKLGEDAKEEKVE